MPSIVNSAKGAFIEHKETPEDSFRNILPGRAQSQVKFLINGQCLNVFLPRGHGATALLQPNFKTQQADLAHFLVDHNEDRPEK